MDPITRDVRALYARHPYPSTPPQLRADSFPRYLLGYLDGGAPDRPLHVLDAGCGTGAALIPIAALHPDCRVVGVDVSPAAVAAVREQARRRGLDNVEVHERDLMDLDGLLPLLDASPGGFDVVYASGMLHHLSDPALGLAHLGRLLSPGGVLSLMVYGHYGRLPVARIARAIELVEQARARKAPAGVAGGAPARGAGADGGAEEGVDDGVDDERVAFARRLVTALGPGSVAQAPWDDGDTIGDVELVDRYLHVHARSYTVAALRGLIDAAGLRWLRWLEPRLWSPRHIFGPGPLAGELEALPATTRWSVIEQLFDRRSLEVLVTHPAARPRPAPTAAALGVAVIARNPQAAVHLVERRVGAEGWIEGISVRVRGGPETALGGMEAALLQSCTQPTPAGALLEAAGKLVPAPREELLEALRGLVLEEVLYAR